MNISFYEALQLDPNRVFGFLGNGAFVMLFLSMVMYWVETAFFDPSNSKKQTSYARSYPQRGYAKGLLPQPLKRWLPKAKNFMGGANILLVCLLLLRWETSGHFPLSNLYESLLFLSWCCTFLHLVLSRNFSIYIQKILGSIIAPCSLLMNAFANFTLPEEMQAVTPLVPALQSNWLMMHVTVMIISYATLIVGSLLSISFLILTKIREKKGLKKDFFSLFMNAPVNSTFLPSQPFGVQTSFVKPQPTAVTPFLPGAKAPATSGKRGLELQLSLWDKQKPQPPIGAGSTPPLGDGKQGFSEGTGALEPQLTTALPEHNLDIVGEGGQPRDSLTNLITSLDYLSYRIIGLGFPFLTIGILSGAVWANEAWGSYWSWDPKETWALLTWLIFAIYLHTRLNFNEKGEKPALIASIGFMVVWFCYLGVNLLGEGLHSYGFFSK